MMLSYLAWYNLSSIIQLYVDFIVKAPIDDRLVSTCPVRWCTPTTELSAICVKQASIVIKYQNGFVYDKTRTHLSRELVQRFIRCLLVLVILDYYTEDSRNTGFGIMTIQKV